MDFKLNQGMLRTMTASLGDSQTTQLNQKQIGELAFYLIFHRFSPFNCWLSVVLLLDKGDYPKIRRLCFCPNK